ncbi:hypothetical protein C7387_2814 [Yokenella regensburgei]|uniref:Uncharacterized protein n=1 Tax=Yokenella regensburgei TaxID=158877 RepID=A0ABX9RYP7_9ENTR|nr:hypothetical protein [Yokenella regensburgei]RKR54648.1 hypothetical protein C7387_2814 [Yokenella regensburgei]VFS25294.1 Uncharacterised protein [Yokenella regensburgei]
MSYLKRVDNKHVAKMIAFRKMFDDFSSERASEHVNSTEKLVDKKTISEKKWIADQLAVAELVYKSRRVSPDEETLTRAVNVLTVLGYTDLARDLGTFTEKVIRSTTFSDIYINNIIDGAIKKNRSDAASGYRHHLSDEILAIMKATWKKNPALSKKKIIAKLMIRYEGRVDEGTLDSWIKKEKLLPPKPKKYLISDLVIPSQYA